MGTAVTVGKDGPPADAAATLEVRRSAFAATAWPRGHTAAKWRSLIVLIECYTYCYTAIPNGACYPPAEFGIWLRSTDSNREPCG